MSFWMDADEQQFLLDHIKPEHHMLEWGSGESTLHLREKVKALTSIEHNKEWYFKMESSLRDIEYIFAPPNNPDWEKQYNQQGVKNEKGDDGSFEDFFDYIHAPVESKNKPFDIVFIDGRARFSCAYISNLVIKPDSLIFIHDFGPDARHPRLGYRKYYDPVYRFLHEVSHVKSMYCFKWGKYEN